MISIIPEQRPSVLLLMKILIFLSVLIYKNKIYLNIGYGISLLLNAVALYISYLLVLKDIGVESNNADRICTFFQQKKSCTDVLKSKASKLFDLVGWGGIKMFLFLLKRVQTN